MPSTYSIFIRGSSHSFHVWMDLSRHKCWRNTSVHLTTQERPWVICSSRWGIPNPHPISANANVYDVSCRYGLASTNPTNDATASTTTNNSIDISTSTRWSSPTRRNANISKAPKAHRATNWVSTSFPNYEIQWIIIPLSRSTESQTQLTCLINDSLRIQL